MIKKLVVMLIIVAIFLISCTATQDNGQPEARPAGTSGTYKELVAALRANGSTVESLDPILQPFFEPEGQVVRIDGQEVQIFEFANEADASLAAADISADGSSIDTTMLSWLATPHFFKSGNLIVLYIGEAKTVVTSLQAVLGPQIAGGATALQTSPPVTETDTPVDTEAQSQQQYVNDVFGLSFRYPVNWFGPEEYVSEQILRVEVGSDQVYPYGTDPLERLDEAANAYHVIIQYVKDGQAVNLNSTYQSLANMQDGESISGNREMIIRVRQLDLGGLTGFEYISTLSETAQTMPVYIREVILMDEQSNWLTILGTPSKVEVGDDAAWRDAYRIIDEANLAFYHEIVESMTIDK
jgi:hypothetical protein